MEWSCSLPIVTAAAHPGVCQAQARNICLSSKRTPEEPEIQKQHQKSILRTISANSFNYRRESCPRNMTKTITKNVVSNFMKHHQTSIKRKRKPINAK